MKLANIVWPTALFMLAIALFAPQVLNDGDTYYHVAAGQWIISHHRVPEVDPFSYTFANAPWVAHEWLAEVLLAVAYRLDGWAGTVALTGIAAGLAVYQLVRHLNRFVPNPAALVLTLLTCACLAPGLLVRPHILALPAMEAWVAGLFIARSLGRVPSWWLLPVMCLWANLHGGFIIGLALVPPLALEAALAEPTAWQRVLRGWGLFFLGGIAAALATPHGLTGLLFPFKLAAMPALSGISEWQPTNFGSLQPLEIVLLVGLYVALSRGAKLPPLRLLLLLGLLHMALQHSRHQQLVGIIAPLLIAEPLGSAFMRISQARVGKCAQGLGAALAVILIALRLSIPILRADTPTSPITAIAHVPTSLVQQAVFNDYMFGGYLIFTGIRPFIDGRADMYGPDFLAQYAAATSPDRKALDALLSKYAVSWTLLSPQNHAVALLDLLPGWCRIYADDIAVVHQRCQP